MKKRIGIIISGQMRSNSLNPNFTTNNIVLESIEKYLLNNEFKSKYDFDIFISTDCIDLIKAFNFFEYNLKNINITECNWYLIPIKNKIEDYEYYYNKYLERTKDFNYEKYLNCFYQHYRMYNAYNMLKNYQSETNVHYDYLVKIRPDIVLMENFYQIFELLENSNKHLFIEHDHIFVIKYHLEDMFKLIDSYGKYKQHIDKKKSLYLYQTKDQNLYNNETMMFCSEKQMIDHIYYILLNKNLDYFKSVYGLVYPSFYLLYRNNLTYGHISDDHPIYHDKSYIWKPYRNLDYIKHTLEKDMIMYKEKYPIKIITVLFVNHKIKKCGVYQYGRRLYDILKKSNIVNFVFCEVESYDEYIYHLQLYDYDLILYNYHPMIMSWLNILNIQKKVKNIGLQHDLDENNIFDITLRLDTTLIERKNRYNIERPIFENLDEKLMNHKISSQIIENFINYNEGPNIPIFGSFGFGFNRKCFNKIVEVVCQNYDNAIIKLLITNADTCSSDLNVIQNCYNSLTKSGVKLMIIQEFIEEYDLLKFLNSNTCNIFLYETHPNAGVSSVIDYALSVKTPLAICNSSWFRHIYSDDISIDKTNIKDIINKSFNVCNKFRELFSNKNLIQTIDNIILDNII